MKKYKYLLFDADNTLFDFDRAEHDAFLMLDALCPGAFTEATYSAYHEINRNVWHMLERGEITKNELKTERFRRHLSRLGVQHNCDLINRIAEEYTRNLSLGTALTDGALETVRTLSEHYAVYIVTNGLTDVQSARLHSSELAPYIDRMFISEEVGFDKPDERFFDYVISEIGEPDRSAYVVIGDSLTSDIDGAARSGIDCIYYDPHSSGTAGRRVVYTVTKIPALSEFLLR